MDLRPGRRAGPAAAWPARRSAAASWRGPDEVLHLVGHVGQLVGPPLQQFGPRGQFVHQPLAACASRRYRPPAASPAARPRSVSRSPAVNAVGLLAQQPAEQRQVVRHPREDLLAAEPQLVGRVDVDGRVDRRSGRPWTRSNVSTSRGRRRAAHRSGPAEPVAVALQPLWPGPVPRPGSAAGWRPSAGGTGPGRRPGRRRSPRARRLLDRRPPPRRTAGLTVSSVVRRRRRSRRTRRTPPRPRSVVGGGCGRPCGSSGSSRDGPQLPKHGVRVWAQPTDPGGHAPPGVRSGSKRRVGPVRCGSGRNGRQAKDSTVGTTCGHGPNYRRSGRQVHPSVPPFTGLYRHCKTGPRVRGKTESAPRLAERWGLRAFPHPKRHSRCVYGNGLPIQPYASTGGGQGSRMPLFECAGLASWVVKC